MVLQRAIPSSSLLLVLALFLVPCMARNLTVVTNSTNEIFVESNGGKEALGFGFALQNNVLSVLLNATATNITDSSYTPISLELAPLRILEFSNLTVINNTATGFPFLTTNSNNTLWGNGLQSQLYQVQAVNSSGMAQVYSIQANYTSDNGGPQFAASFYITSELTMFQGVRLAPNAITMIFSILNAPQLSANNTLGLDQLIVSRRSLPKPLVTPFSNGTRLREEGILAINRTALVDGRPYPILLFPISSTSDASLNDQVFVFDLQETSSARFALAFVNSDKAANVTFEQRLVAEAAKVFCVDCGKDNSTDSNNGNNPAAQSHAGPSMSLNFWAILLLSLLLLVPALVF